MDHIIYCVIVVTLDELITSYVCSKPYSIRKYQKYCITSVNVTITCIFSAIKITVIQNLLCIYREAFSLLEFTVGFNKQQLIMHYIIFVRLTLIVGFGITVSLIKLNMLSSRFSGGYREL